MRNMFPKASNMPEMGPDLNIFYKNVKNIYDQYIREKIALT